MTITFVGVRTASVRATDETDYTYRTTGEPGEGSLPLVLLQHFRGNLDNWDPAFAADVDAFLARA